MFFQVLKTKEELGAAAAKVIAGKLNAAIEKRGYARMILSTGASQFDTLKALVNEDVDWEKVTMFHLDEYVALPESHSASFRKYLKERFVAKVGELRAVHFVNGEGDAQANIAALTAALREDSIDVGVIGIGENCHIAFNDPPADFNTKEAYFVVNLDERCKQQQVGEGWFATPDDVLKQDPLPDHAVRHHRVPRSVCGQGQCDQAGAGKRERGSDDPRDPFENARRLLSLCRCGFRFGLLRGTAEAIRGISGKHRERSPWKG